MPTSPTRLALAPITLTDAREFVTRHHRHHPAPQGGLFAVAASWEGEIVGVVIIVIVLSVAPGIAGSSELAFQIAGIANYLIMILGFLALLSIVVAGVLLILSIDEGLKEKAKTIIKTSIIGLIVVLVSYALVTGFIAM